MNQSDLNQPETQVSNYARVWMQALKDLPTVLQTNGEKGRCRRILQGAPPDVESDFHPPLCYPLR